MAEWQDNGPVFGCYKIPYLTDPERYIDFVGHRIETPVGPAAGPNTQLAQNIVAAYVCGGRIFELKTVQVIDGEDLHVSKPCILAEDEGYNCEWSTELTVPQAFEEYVKAWFLLNLLSKELELDGRRIRLHGREWVRSGGHPSKKIDDFIEGLEGRLPDPDFQALQAAAAGLLPRCKRAAQDVGGHFPHMRQHFTVHHDPAARRGEI